MGSLYYRNIRTFLDTSSQFDKILFLQIELFMIKNTLFFLLVLAFSAIFFIFAANKKMESVNNKNIEIHNLPSLKKYLSSPKNLRNKLKLNLKVYKPEKVSPGYILLPVSGTAEVYIINHKLEILHSWPVDAERARLSSNCNLGVIFGSKWGEKRSPWKDIKGAIVEFDWNSNILWKYLATDILHHDFQYLSDDTFLLLRRKIVSQNLRNEELRDPQRWDSIRADLVFQIDRTGKTLWDWPSWEHLDVNSCGRRIPCIFQKEGKDRNKIRGQDWTHINAVSFLPENKWHKSGHKKFAPGNLLIMPRNLWESYIVDSKTGKVLWNYGGTQEDPLIYGHEAHMIPEGYLGAGHILIFDNGAQQRPYSIIKEINPITKETVWHYKNEDSFFSPSGGSAQRLPNGNTFISGDNGGNIFEVTPNGDIVWQLQSNFRVFRAHKYPQNYCPKLPKLN